MAKPDTILAWYRRLVAHKFDGSRQRADPGRLQACPKLEVLVVRFARENRSWGYDRIAGALANLGHRIFDQTVGNILRRHNIAPAPERSRTTTWREFIRSHTDVLAGADFFTVEVLSWRESEPAVYRWAASRAIRTRAGWNKWRATPRWRTLDI